MLRPLEGQTVSYRDICNENTSMYWPYYKIKISFSEDSNEEIKFFNGEIDITELINKYIINQLKSKDSLLIY